jgi:hypothetical protein
MVIYISKIVCALCFILIIASCEGNSTDQKTTPLAIHQLANEPSSPDAPEIYYDRSSEYFSSCGTDMNGKGRNYYIAPGSKTWEHVGRRNMSNTEWRGGELLAAKQMYFDDDGGPVVRIILTLVTPPKLLGRRMKGVGYLSALSGFKSISSIKVKDQK